ncbi:MAG: YraN family protein [Limnochordaceae bacterium]|nr:YraN family protein [Limnochordaceae bacterium]
MTSGSQERGQAGERAAAEWLERQGCVILDRNVAFKVGELDLVAEDPEGVVLFVEVRARAPWAGRPGIEVAAASIGRDKQARWRRAARAYVSRHPRLMDRPLRFDVVVVGLDGQGRPHEIAHVPGVLEA